MPRNTHIHMNKDIAMYADIEMDPKHTHADSVRTMGAAKISMMQQVVALPLV